MGQSSSRKQGDAVGSDLSVKPSNSNRTSTPTNKLVAVGDLVQKKGTIAVTGRYICDRPMSDFYHVEPKVVGSGMSGQVYLATNLANKTQHAVKSFKKTGLNEKKRQELKGEVEIYLALDHPHVARLDRVFETDTDLFLVMEFMAGGELYDRLSAKKQYNEQLAANTTYQMLLAVSYLHAHKIAHRDLKLENFLYEAKETDHLKLIDFGFAKFRDHDTKMSQACGSVHYVAPEVLSHSYTEKADLWSLGVIVYMLLTGSPPFHGSDDEVLKKIKAGKPHWSSRFNKLSEPAKLFVKELLVTHDKRLTAEQALQHQWIREKHTLKDCTIDNDIVKSLRNYAHASSFRRAVLSMMAWSLGTSERKELRELFLSIDTENRGTITHSELKSILEENFNISSMEIDSLFKNLDTDNDQEIAYTEFLAAALQGRVKVHENLLRDTFARFDKDGGGKISKEELTEVLGAQFEGHEITDLIMEADLDNDGQVDYNEFIAYFHKLEEPEPETAEAGTAGTASQGTRARAGTAASMKDGKSVKEQNLEKMGLLLDTMITAVEPEKKEKVVHLKRKSDKGFVIGGM